MEFYTHSPKETEAVGARLGSALSPGSVVAYFGGLGMGKLRLPAGLPPGLVIRGGSQVPHLPL